MPPSFWPARLGCLTLVLLAAPAAQAVDGTITINGQITDQTCKINGKTPPADFIVNLPKISTTALKTKGDTAGATVFNITLTDCPATLTEEVRAHFEPGITTDYASGALFAYTPITETDISTATSPASSIPSRGAASKAMNVQIQLANTDGTAIKIGAAAHNTKGVMPVAEGDKKKATLQYLARYLKTGDAAVTAGALVTYVQYSIVYP